MPGEVEKPGAGAGADVGDFGGGGGCGDGRVEEEGEGFSGEEVLFVETESYVRDEMDGLMEAGLTCRSGSSSIRRKPASSFFSGFDMADKLKGELLEGKIESM